jgi:hypothetical protein
VGSRTDSIPAPESPDCRSADEIADPAAAVPWLARHRVEVRLILMLDREVAERLTARAISVEKNLGQFVTEIVEAAASDANSGLVVAGFAAYPSWCTGSVNANVEPCPT